MAGIADNFRGLPIEELIVSPIVGMAKGQAKLNDVTWKYIQEVAFVKNKGGATEARSLDVEMNRVATDGDTTVAGSVTATNFVVSSDRRLKSEIEPIKEGLEVIKKFSSYNYIKGGEKESGFIAQEVREAIPHTVYENNEGYLSMSDRGVLAHMHKAILELDKRLEAIEEKLK